MTEPPPSPDQPGEFVASALRLAAAVTDDRFESDMREILVRGLASDADPLRATKNITSMLNRYFGDEDTSIYLVGLLAYGPGMVEDGDSLAAIPDAAVRERLDAIIGRLAGLYGLDVQRGLDLTTRSRHDWQYIDVKPLYELERATWTIEVTLTSFGQEIHQIIGSPLSMLRIVNHLLGALNSVASNYGDYVGIFDQEAIEYFTDSSQALLDGIHTQLTAPPEGAEPPGPVEEG